MKMPKHSFRTPTIPPLKIKQPNYQNMLAIVVFIVGGFLVYRMVSSVQRQLLLLKKDVSNLQEEVHNPQSISPPPHVVGFDMNFTDVDCVSVDSVDIDEIMNKLTAPLDRSVEEIVEKEEDTRDEQGLVSDDVPIDDVIHSETQPSKIIEIEIETEDDIQNKSIAELRKMMKDKGLQVKGNKAQLVDALKSQNQDQN